VFGAAIAVRAFVDIARVDVGFDSGNVVRVAVAAPRTETNQQNFFSRAIQTLSALPMS
jgi:hypothetical protein